jgi:glycosyltransferase involved in cell wall biosynthesis
MLPVDTLLLPQNESAAIPELSIVIPALNEEITISEFVAWSLQGLREADIDGEILIIDSSTDRTAELAVAGGARVLKTPKRGLGRAYQDALPHVRGRFVLMGDADCTYDFREIKAFVESFRSGNEFIMGSRFRGFIEDGAMPPLHRYFGTPITTTILNLIYGSKFTDIHCGMRGITRDAFTRMRLRSGSWEYASEMVLKSVQMQLKTDEVPVRFLKDKDGRHSHHKREGWLSPWKAGWINLRAMLISGADFFALRPGIALFLFGLALTLPLTLGPVKVGPITFSIFWMLLGVSLTVVGLQSFYMGCLARLLNDFNGRSRKFWLNFFSYDRSIFCSALLIIVGCLFLVPLCYVYWKLHLRLPDEVGTVHHMAITGLLCVMLGFMNFVFTLVLHASAAAVAVESPQSEK